MKSQQSDQLRQLRLQQGFKKLQEHFLEVLHQQPPARELQVVQQEVRPQLCQRLCQHWQLSRQLFQAKDLQPRLQAPQDF